MLENKFRVWRLPVEGLRAGGAEGGPEHRYLEIEFTATGTRTLRVEYSFLPGVACDAALARP